MAYQVDQETGDIVVNGFEQGVFPSPHKGIANIQNANIATESGEVMASFARAQQTMTNSAATGALSFLDSSHVNLSIANTNNLFKGNWIVVTGSSNTGQLPNGTYYVPPSTGAGFKLANYYNTANYYTPVTVTVLTVGGGGGAGGATSNQGGSGGGGGGQVVSSTISSIQLSGAYTVNIGSGGAGASAGATGTTGSSSLVAGKAISTSAGGGLGGLPNNGGTPSGGASASGKAGGGYATNGPINGAGGGGGDSAVGSTGFNDGSGNMFGGAGGAGTSSSISGASVQYGGGGGGGAGPTGTGGSATGGGGAGSTTTGTTGTANTGGGGGGSGGGGAASRAGANGGSGVVIISIPTSAGVTATGGTHTTSGGNDIWTFTASGTWTPTMTITTVAPSLTGFTAGLTASFTLLRSMGKPVAQATENYYANSVPYHRYYVLDNQNLVWVYDDQNEVTYSSTDGVAWLLPDSSTSWCTNASGIGVISGFLIAATSTGLYGKPVVTLGQTNATTTTWVQFPDVTGWHGSLNSTTINHFCFVGHQGVMYVTDSSYITSVFPTSTIATTGITTDNVQTLASWTVASQFAGSYSIVSGSSPVPSDNKRVPVVFFTSGVGTLPTAISANTVYYLQTSTDGTFNVYTASTGGSPLDVSAGTSGTQYISTFYPIASASASTGTTPTWVFSPERVALPKYEISQCIAEIGNNALIGCAGSVVYPWDQVQNLPVGLINLPESNVSSILTVNQMGYIFTGNKANVYITDGNQASQVIKVPDYAAGVPGSPATYVEPQFTWGGTAYIRGRVYFSLQDQTATKTGNCGGVWSFIPTQNLYIGQDTGIALRLENKNSYNTYNGMAPLLIPRLNQVSGPPLYWSAWQSDQAGTTYGIDYSTLGTNASFTTIVESDAIPTGTMLTKKTFKQIEFKLASPLDTAATVVMNYRKDITSAWNTCGAINIQKNRLSGLFPANFEKTQWLQLQTIITPVTSTATTNSFVRMSEIRIR